MAKPIGTVGVTESLVIAGYTFPDATAVLFLQADFHGGSHYSTVRKNGATSGYQVTAGKTLKIKVICIHKNNTASLEGYNIGYGDTDSGIDGSVPTNPVYAYESADVDLFVGPQWESPQVYFFDVPSGKYPFIKNVSGVANMAVMYAYEV